MNFRPSFPLISTAALAIALSLSGCKSNSAPAANQANPTAANSQPAAGQPASGQPSSMQPAPGQPGEPPGRRAAAPQAPPPPAVITIPSGTPIRVRLDQDLGSKISQPGDSFAATVANDVLVNGEKS